MFNDLTGTTIGSWTVLHRQPNVGTATIWKCRCACGTERDVRAAHLSSGASASCGCAPHARTHGHAINGEFSKKYRTWRYIMNRCTCPGNQDYDRYAGLLHEPWKNFETFNAEVPDPPSDDLTIDRIKNDRGYEPGNVRWVSMADQHRNQSNCRWIEYGGKRQLLSDWAKELGIHTSTLAERIDKYGIEKAITTPKGGRLHE